MREWRRTLKSWPEETSRTADPASMPAALRDPARLAEARREERRWSLAAIAMGSLVPMGLMFAGTAWLAGAGYDTLAVLTMVSGMGLGIVGLFPAAKVAEEWKHTHRRRRALEILEARGDATLGGEFVGVAYGDGLWHHHGLGHDADEGVLHLDFDRLTFVGRASGFEIPKDAILATEIRVFPAAITGPAPRIYVTYAHEGGTGALSLALPYRCSARRRVQEAAEMKDRLDAWRAERLPSLPARPFVAPFLGAYDVAGPDRSRETGLLAKLLAVPATVLLLVSIEIVMTVISIRMGWRRTGYGLLTLVTCSNLVWAVLAKGIERRLPEQYRFRVKETEDVRDTLRSVASRAEQERMNGDIKVR